MDYRSIAKELLTIRAELARTPYHRRMDEFVRGEYFVLNYLLHHQGKAYPKDLSSQMCVSTARIAALLRQMEKKEWITRTSDVRDNRQTIISLTDRGACEIRDREDEITDIAVSMLKELGPEDAKEILRIHRKLIKNRERMYWQNDK